MFKLSGAGLGSGTIPVIPRHIIKKHPDGPILPRAGDEAARMSPLKQPVGGENPVME
jgi:hypothetical protein